MMSSPRASGGSTSPSAARLLIVLEFGQTPSGSELAEFPDAMKVIRAMSRLANLDFWLRNPDDLADEVLTDIEASHIDAQVGLRHVERMLAGPAPLLHLYPRQRYKYRVWELPDNAVGPC